MPANVGVITPEVMVIPAPIFTPPNTVAVAVGNAYAVAETTPEAIVNPVPILMPPRIVDDAVGRTYGVEEIIPFEIVMDVPSILTPPRIVVEAIGGVNVAGSDVMFAQFT